MRKLPQPFTVESKFLVFSSKLNILLALGRTLWTVYSDTIIITPSSIAPRETLKSSSERDRDVLSNWNRRNSRGIYVSYEFSKLVLLI